MKKTKKQKQAKTRIRARKKKLVSIIEPKTKEEFEAALKNAKGNVVVDFTQEGCGACDPASLDKLREKCGDTTIMRVDCGDGWGANLADNLGVEGTPTTLLAPKAESFSKALAATSPAELGDVELEEIDPTDPETVRRFKCAR